MLIFKKDVFNDTNHYPFKLTKRNELLFYCHLTMCISAFSSIDCSPFAGISPISMAHDLQI